MGQNIYVRKITRPCSKWVGNVLNNVHSALDKMSMCQNNSASQLELQINKIISGILILTLLKFSGRTSNLFFYYIIVIFKTKIRDMFMEKKTAKGVHRLTQATQIHYVILYSISTRPRYTWNFTISFTKLQTLSQFWCRHPSRERSWLSSLATDIFRQNKSSVPGTMPDKEMIMSRDNFLWNSRLLPLQSHLVRVHS